MYAVSRMLTETTIDSVRNERLTGRTRLISSCDNVKHDLESLLEQIGGGPPLNLLYTIFHDFVYLLLTNGTPFKYLAKNFASLLTAGNQHCHKIGISHKYRSLPE